jgi:uncharacterized protein (TIGR02646 family)
LIRIVKSAAAPAKLAEGAALVAAHEQARLDDPTSGSSKLLAFKFDKKIYGDKTVKTALRTAQHDKCCYCEGVFAAQSSGDVEHFRPKTCVQQAKGAPMDYPGYYWLVYTWSNLYYSCEICNRIGKRNLFPVLDPAQRNRRGGDDRGEIAAILDPGGVEDPRDHIRFNGAAVEGVTDLGRRTIETLGLHRDDLTTARLGHLQLLDALKDLADIPDEELTPALLVKKNRAQAQLDQTVRENATYSSMARDYLQP